MSKQEITRNILSVCSFNHNATFALTEKSTDGQFHLAGFVGTEVVEGLTFDILLVVRVNQ